MTRLLIWLVPLMALTACETAKGFIKDVENTTDAVVEEIEES